MRLSPHTLGLLIATSLTFTALPAIAQPDDQVAKQSQITEITGKVCSDDQGGVLIRHKGEDHRVLGDLVQPLLTLLNREVTVTGLVSPKIGPDGKLTRTIEVSNIDSPRLEVAVGRVEKRGGKAILMVDSERRLRLTRAPQHLLIRLVDRRITARGWLFTAPDKNPELYLTSVEATVNKRGYVSQSGPRRDGNEVDVSVGQPLRVVGLAAYNPKKKRWRNVASLDEKDGDMLFAKVQVGRPGEEFAGWIPAYKLDIGQALPKEQQQQADKNPEQREIQKEKNQNARGARGVLEQEKKVEQTQETFQDRVKKWVRWTQVGGLTVSPDVLKAVKKRIADWGKSMREAYERFRYNKRMEKVKLPQTPENKEPEAEEEEEDKPPVGDFPLPDPNVRIG